MLSLLSLQLPTNRPALPRHGLIAEGVTPANLREKKDRFAHKLKVANRSGLVSQTLLRG